MVFFDCPSWQAYVIARSAAQTFSLQQAPPSHHGLHIDCLTSPWEEGRCISLRSALQRRNTKVLKVKEDLSSRRDWVREYLQRVSLPLLTSHIAP